MAPIVSIQRISAPDQVAGFLRAGLAAARWSGELPSEAELCRELNVSRVTLRRGIDQLVHDGWLRSGGRGRHHQICRVGIPRIASPGHTVRMLGPYSLHDLGSIEHVMLDALTGRLDSAGYRFKYEHRPALFARHSPDEYKQLAELSDTAAWILHFSTRSMQCWFADNKIPCLVFGQRYEGVMLPHIFPDGPSVGRHAAGLFYRRGHRELVYLAAENCSLNDRQCGEAFVFEAQQLGCLARIVNHPRGRVGLSHALNGLLAAPGGPTGYLCSSPQHCLTTLCYLQDSGLHVPADVSIIAGWDHEFLHFAVPEFACYRVDGKKMGRQTGNLVLDLIKHGSEKSRTISVLAAFHPGETLGPCPAVPNLPKSCVAARRRISLE